MKRLYKQQYRTNSARLKGYDYSRPRHYFVTICTKDKKHYFGQVRNWEMHLSEMGKIVSEEWLRTFKLRKRVILDEWVVMPNHVHMIVFIDHVETHCNASLHNLAHIIRGFKSASTKKINSQFGKKYFAWQSSYYDRIIRNYYELERTRQYIRENPQNWDQLSNKVENISDEIKKLYHNKRGKSLLGGFLPLGSKG